MRLLHRRYRLKEKGLEIHLRSDKHPNGLPNLSFVDRLKISKANKLYFLTSKLVQWAVAEGCIFCIENPQFNLFWQTTFMQSVIHLMNFTTFQTCMYGSKRPKRTMLGFNAEEFTVLNKMCSGVTSNHRHDSWGVHAGSNKFATSLETAYPTMLARAIAAQFVLALQNRGIRMPPETLTAIGASDDATLAAMRAQTGLQPKASRLPLLIPSFAAKVSLSGFCEDLPVAHIPNTNCQPNCMWHPNQLQQSCLKAQSCCNYYHACCPPRAYRGGCCVGTAAITRGTEQVCTTLSR